MSTTVNEPAERFALSQTLYEWITKNSIDLECCVRMGADIMYKKIAFGNVYANCRETATSGKRNPWGHQ